MTPKTRFGTNVYLSTYGTSLFIQACTVLQGVLLARLLGPEGRGQLAAVQLWPSLFATAWLFGFNMAIARRAGKSEDVASLVRSALLVSLGTGALGAITCLISLPYLIPEKIASVLPVASLFVLYIPINHLALNLLGVYQGLGNFTVINISRAILYPAYFIGLVLVWLYAENKLLYVVISLLVANLLVVFTQISVKISSITKKWALVSIPSLFKEGLPFHLTTAFSMINDHVDQLLFIFFLNPVELGFYVVARSAASIIISLSKSLGLITFSEAARLNRSNGFIPLAETVRRGAIASVVMGTGLAILLPLLLPLVYGQEFLQAVSISIVLVSGMVLLGLVSIIEQALRGHGFPTAGIMARIGGMAVFILLGITGARELGGVGIAGAFVVSQLTCFTIFLVISIRFFENSSISEYIPKYSDVCFFYEKNRGFIKK